MQDGDTIEVCIYNFNKLFANKLIGRFVMVLQQVVKDGQLEVEETLLDDNNSALAATIRLTVTYQAPDGTVGSWRTEDFRVSATQYFLDLLNTHSHLDEPIPHLNLKRTRQPWTLDL